MSGVKEEMHREDERFRAELKKAMQEADVDRMQEVIDELTAESKLRQREIILRYNSHEPVGAK